MSTNPDTRAWVEVRADALLANYRRIRDRVGPGARMLPMVKADAYGLGVAETVRALEPEEPWGYGVATVDEGLRLRALGVRRPVSVFSPSPPEALEAAVGADLQVSVSSREALADLLRAGRTLGTRPAFHAEIDTGMGRAGFPAAEVGAWGPELAAAERAGARWVSAYTHLHSADEDPATIDAQWATFERALAGIGAGPEVVVHALNSAGALRAPGLARGAVRPGIFLYGGGVGDPTFVPEAVASVRARVVHVRHAAPGDTVGYGATWVAREPECWATLAIGYGDGLPRALSNRGEALLGGRRVRIIGRISMDVTVVLMRGAPVVGVGEVATLMGRDGDDEITVDEVARLAGTISYEVLTGLTPRLPRVWPGLT